MASQNSSEYLFEYKTHRSELSRTIERAFLRIIGVGMCGVILLAAWMLHEMIGATVRLVPACGSLFVMFLLVAFAVFAIMAYNPKLILGDYYTPLTVCISQEEVFIREKVHGFKTDSIFREHIPIEGIKNASVKIYTRNEYHQLYKDNYIKRRSLLFGRPLSLLLQDGSSVNNLQACCAVLEITDGRHLFIEFKAAEEFIEVLNSFSARFDTEAKIEAAANPSTDEALTLIRGREWM